MSTPVEGDERAVVRQHTARVLARVPAAATGIAAAVYAWLLTFVFLREYVHPWLVVAAGAAAGASMWAMLARVRRPILVAAAWPALTAVVAWQVRRPDELIAVWPITLAPLVLGVLAMVSHRTVAWGATLSTVALLVLRASSWEVRPTFWLELLAYCAPVIAGTFFFTGALTAITGLNSAMNEEVQALGTLREIQSRQVARRLFVRDVRAVAEPPLTLIASGRDLTAAERRDCALAEGELRDRIRGGRLMVGTLPAAVVEARSRGAQVSLVDDGGEDVTLPEGFVDRARAELATLGSGDRVMLRILPPGRSDVVRIVVTRAPNATD